MRNILLALIIALLACPASGQPGDLPVSYGHKEVNGTSLYYKTLGMGEPLLVVHGGPGLSHDYLVRHLRPLARDHMLIFYDQRVSGLSSMEVDSSDITLGDFVEDIEGLRKAFSIEKIDILGHSWGGLLAMKYAAKYPGKVRALVLVNTIAASGELNDKANSVLAKKFSEADSKRRIEILNTEAFKNLEPEAIEQLMMIGFRHQFYDTSKARELELALNDKYAVSSSLLQYLGGDLYDYDFHVELKQISAPALLVYGEHDPLMEITGNKLEKTIPDAELIMFESSGHFPFIEEQEKFINEVRSFLER